MKHVHKYRRMTTTKGKLFWRCVDPGCTHVIFQESLMPGRITRCWICDEETKMENLDQAKPVCDDCKEFRRQEAEKYRNIVNKGS